MAAPSAWANLSPEEVSKIARRVPCEWDRAHMDMAFVCRSWRAGLAASPPLPPPLPRLLLPSDDFTRVSCILSSCSIHQGYHDPDGLRYLGSCDGGYLFLAMEQTRRHRLMGLLQAGGGRIHLLPDEVCPRYDPSVQHVHNMVILAATLSSAPDVPGCLAAGIVTYQRDVGGPRQRRCAFWCIGDRVAYDSMPPYITEPVEDVVYRDDGFFHFLTDEEHILASAPTFFQDGDEPLRGCWTLRRCVPRDTSHDGFVRARYLLESRGELLMIVRLAPDPDSPTSGFKVFSRTGPLALEDDGSGGMVGHPYVWRELDALGGRMLFVGRGCSRSYEVAQYPGFRAGIYFLDDRSFYDDQIMFCGVDERQYPCSDTGKWTQGPLPNVERFFPEEGPSNHSSPVWFLQDVAKQRCWKDLLPELVAEVSNHLHCPVDQYRMSRVCPEWQKALLLPRRPHLPFHPVRFRGETGVARFIGAYDGGWMFVASKRTTEHRLINVTNGYGSISLPDRMSLHLGETEAMIIRAATLSSPPVVRGCVAGAIVTPPHPRSTLGPAYITFWRVGSRLASGSHEVVEGVEDVIYHQNAFHFLTKQKNLLICSPEFEEGTPVDQLRVEVKELRFQLLVDEENEWPCIEDFYVAGRYLVESRGELLMVVRTRPGSGATRVPTSSFRVFQMMKVQITEPGRADYCWNELLALDGRMLFVGRRCSRSFEAIDFPGSQEGVYFHDDQFGWTFMIWGYAYMMGQMYHCRDNGVCSVLPNAIRPLLPAGHSNTSSPIWCLH
ncbi:uncharacterized protein C2845_PM05G29150 [Panicum miliaceum]|uniref:KIB1-4 beta-propeller domain-containing protein n=1 Tax=Panicum miliaceum TaxID=4540 RepID=A0A3L6SZK1_PANMI|nr:uncharacterized protein C2845_PM05G29150 [Panicum miliaceum]